MQAREVVFLQRARACIGETKRADAASIVENKWAASIEPDARVVGDERTTGKSRVLEGVGDNHRLAAMNDVSAKGGVA